MPSDNRREVLGDIRYYIELIGRFVEGYDLPRFADDPRTFHAVTRERVVWATVQDALPPLLHAIRLELGPDE
jgi:uncharacterized protein with HEPN domain